MTSPLPAIREPKSRLLGWDSTGASSSSGLLIAAANTCTMPFVAPSPSWWCSGPQSFAEIVELKSRRSRGSPSAARTPLGFSSTPSGRTWTCPFDKHPSEAPAPLLPQSPHCDSPAGQAEAPVGGALRPLGSGLIWRPQAAVPHAPGAEHLPAWVLLQGTSLPAARLPPREPSSAVSACSQRPRRRSPRR